MDQNLLLAVMAGFVVISAIALCIQAGLLFGIYRAAREMQQQSSTLIPQAKSILHLTETTLQESRQHIVDITAKANNMMDTAKAQLVKVDSITTDVASSAKAQLAKMDTLTTDVMGTAKAQMAKVDALVTDATARAKNQIERAEMVVDDTVSRVHESVAAVHNGILVPVRQVNAFATGVRTAVSVFLRGGRPNVSEATQDTEMFI